MADIAYFQYGANEVDYLKRQDPQLARAIERIGSIERPVMPDLFTALISSIVHQQISNKAAVTVWGRVMQRFGSITPQTVEEVPVEEIQKLGMSMRKAVYIKRIGAAVADGQLDLKVLHSLPDHEVVQRLSAQPGIGVWTAEMLMIFSMQRPDVVSWHD
ncbi:DNA-3-methyladenine glycosylase 2 family protein, partial [bacterium]|nr:DNA-3-methyladenine glycosylase 2 family protein [bacterium]